MARKIHVTRPTKIELTRLKRRLKLASRIQKIVKDRLSILIMEFLQTVRECASIKENLLGQYDQAFRSLLVTEGYHGRALVLQEILLARMPFEVQYLSRNVAGVRVPLFELQEIEQEKLQTELSGCSSAMCEKTGRLSRKCLETIVDLSERQKTLELLGSEINKVKRINNALEYVIIPGLEETIKYLTMKFEERDREEADRLKRVKLLIEGRQAYAY
ncbi:MAG: V-type ATP synthase subunit D [Deltaproteobacteria bacterium]|nr:V-type ATP synthase subunit D [Deltaproteobacteria bacterium]